MFRLIFLLASANLLLVAGTLDDGAPEFAAQKNADEELFSMSAVDSERQLELTVEPPPAAAAQCSSDQEPGQAEVNEDEHEDGDDHDDAHQLNDAKDDAREEVYDNLQDDEHDDVHHDAHSDASANDVEVESRPNLADSKLSEGSRSSNLASQDEYQKSGSGAGQDSAEPWQEPSNKLNFFTLLATGFKWHYENQYDKINTYLVNELPDNLNVGENLAKAREWLEKERERGVSIFRNQVTVEALEQFLQLGRLEEEGTRCSREAYAILWKNDRATRGRAQRPPSHLGPLRRIDTIMRIVSVQHTINCFHVYPEKLVELRNKMDRRALRLVETYLNNLLKSSSCDWTTVKSVKGKKAVELAFDLILKNSHHDPDRRFLGKVVDELKGKLVVRESGVRGLVERYITGPCYQFVAQLGPDVFIPARFGVSVFEREDRYSDIYGDFVHAWRQYRLCESLLRKDKEPLIKNLVRFVARKSA